MDNATVYRFLWSGVHPHPTKIFTCIETARMALQQRRDVIGQGPSMDHEKASGLILVGFTTRRKARVANLSNYARLGGTIFPLSN